MQMFYTLEETAEKLGITADEVDLLSRAGTLQAFRDRDKVMFKREQIDSLLALNGDRAIDKKPKKPVDILMPVKLPNPPRVVEGGGGCAVWLGRLILIPHTLIGVGMACALIFQLLALGFSSAVPGVATGVKTWSSKGHDYYSLDYSYIVSGEKHDESQSVDHAAYTRFQNFNTLEAADKQVEVKHFGLGPFQQASLPAYGSSGPPLPVLFFAATVWNTIMGFVFFETWVKPNRLRQLHRDGLSTTGTIVSKRKVEGKRVAYFVSYEFVDPGTGELFTGETEVLAEPWEAAAEGKQVTVLYAEKNPKRNTMYGAGIYKTFYTLETGASA